MIFLIVGIISFLLAVFFLKKGKEDAVTWFVVVFLFCAVLFSGTVLEAMSDYLYLLEKKEYVLSLKADIKTIRNATYKTKIDGSLVAGSIENLKQSTNLSGYIREYAIEKAKFNKQLKRRQNIKNYKVYWVLLSTNFIDSRINEIKKID